jgi:hypothetical protein
MIAVRGPARLRMRLDPAAGFGRHGMRSPRRDDTGCWHGYVADLRMRFSGAPEASVSDGDGAGSTLDTVFSIDEGDHHDLVFELADTAPDAPLPAAQWLWEATEAGWAGAIPALDASIASRDARHSYAVLRGMTSAGGGMVAAATGVLALAATLSRARRR